ncbi:MAG: hypothetical protein [Bacteriophage sp.]|nr:MAG: hypothetical protein [Bacteriophage sp.]
MQKFIYTELGKEKLCIGCNEYYPCDNEFFYGTGRYNKHGVESLDARCKACYNAKYRPSRTKVYNVSARYAPQP